MRRFCDVLLQALKSLFRNGPVSLVSIFILTCCLLFVGSFGVIALNISYNFEDVSELNEIEVFLEFDADVETVERIEREILRLDNVESVTYVSKQEGLEGMQTEFVEYGNLFDDITDEENPLSDMFRVVYTDNERVTTLDYNLKQLDGVRKVNSRLDIAATVGSLENGISIIFIWFAVILTIVCIFVVSNTIKMSIYLRREEITAMRYIGASRRYIAAPFIFEGLYVGAIGTLIAFLLERVIYSALQSYISANMGIVKLYTFGEVAPILLAAFIAISVLCGVIGSLVSMSKYVEV
ncbi:MAG: ABC transporter permease [Clostridia bacterium]|nr:ABC transporter permease [Clostridia bacterium]